MWHIHKYDLKHPSLINILLRFNLSDKGNTNIFAFTTPHLRGQTNAIFLYVSRSVISQDISRKHIEMSGFRDYILTLALHIERTRV